MGQLILVYVCLRRNQGVGVRVLQNIVIANSTLTADIIMPNEFFDKTVSVKDLSVSVLYTGKAIASMTLNYKTENSTVTLEYKFS